MRIIRSKRTKFINTLIELALVGQQSPGGVYVSVAGAVLLHCQRRFQGVTPAPELPGKNAYPISASGAIPF